MTVPGPFIPSGGAFGYAATHAPRFSSASHRLPAVSADSGDILYVTGFGNRNYPNNAATPYGILGLTDVDPVFDGGDSMHWNPVTGDVEFDQEGLYVAQGLWAVDAVVASGGGSVEFGFKTAPSLGLMIPYTSLAVANLGTSVQVVAREFPSRVVAGENWTPIILISGAPGAVTTSYREISVGRL